MVVTDPNAGQTDTVTVTPSDPANGTLGNLDGGSYDATTGVWSDTGTAAAVTAALDGLEFAPTINQVAPGLTVTTTFTIAATDTAGATATDSTTSVVATDVAVLPTITGTFPDWTTIDQASVAPFSRAVIADANPGQTETVTVTLSDTANGELYSPDGGGYDPATGVWSDTGTAAAVTAALNGLAFTPTINQVAPGLTVTTTFSMVVTDTAGGGATDSTTSVVATDVAVPPTVTGTFLGWTVTDQATITPFSGVAIADANSGQTEAVTVVLYDPPNGTLENLGGGSYDGTTGVYTDTGAAAAVTEALDGLVFSPTFGQAPVGQTVSTGFSINVTDSAGAFANDSTTRVITTEVPCYLRGTRIATPAGECAVESLAAGDLVLTRAGAARPITWIGHRRVDCRRHRRPHEVFPVRVRAGAFGDGLPGRDLRLSPDHAVFMYDALIPIRCVINGATVVQERAAVVSYFHVELPSHDVILAEGLPAESYLDLGNRGAFDNGGGAIVLHPDFGMRVWQREACAQLILGGPVLVAVKQRLLLQARLLGHAVTGDPGISVIANGRVLHSDVAAGRYRIVLPRSARHLRIRSRTWIPSHMRPVESDRRRLGVSIARVWLDRREVSLESPGLSRGWHEPEHSWRWTDGDAVLEVDGARELAFDVARTGTYWVNRSEDHDRESNWNGRASPPAACRR